MRKMHFAVAIPLLLAACADGGTPTSITGNEVLEPTAPAPSAAVVGSFSSNTKAASWVGSTTAAGFALAQWVEGKFDNTHGAPGPTPLDNWFILTFPPFCFDSGALASSDANVSMGKSRIDVATACGPLDLELRRSGPVIVGNNEGWFSFPTPGIENCSPPPGETSIHFTSSGKNATASASGSVGAPITATTFAQVSHGTSQSKICQ